MNTPTHSLIALALLTRREEPIRNRAVFIGALIPDLAIYLWAPWQRYALGRDWGAIWDVHYFEAPMQTVAALFNSVPIYVALAGIGFVFRRSKLGLITLFMALAALIHIAFDLPFHAHDAYRHFWPFSDWRFHSPISYWEPAYHARWVSIVEFAIVIGSAAILWRRFPALWVKIVVTLMVLGTFAMTLVQQLAAIHIPS